MNSKEIFVSICILTCNRKKELLRLLESCVSNLPPNVEFLICDNNSSDGTELAVRNYLNCKNLKFRYYYQTENLGVAGGRNFLFNLAVGEYLFFIDDDSEIISTASDFNKEIKMLEGDETIAIIGTEIYDVLRKGFFCGSALLPSSPANHETFTYNGGSHIIRKKSFAKLKNLYPHNLFYGAEEQYASLVALGMGLKVLYSNRIKTIHRPSKNSRIENNLELILHSLINKFVIHYLLMPKIFHPLILLLLILRLIKHFRLKTLYYAKSFNLLKIKLRDNLSINLLTTSMLIKIGFKYRWKNIL